jgi:hypothetical protein
MQAPANIWVPNSFTYREAMVVNKVVREYDPELQFGRNESNGQWCIFMERNGEKIPILGFQGIPHPDDAVKRLYNSDARRHGSKILDDMNKHNEKLRLAREDEINDATGQLAEAAEFGAREDGLHDKPRIFVPGRD